MLMLIAFIIICGICCVGGLIADEITDRIERGYHNDSSVQSH